MNLQTILDTLPALSVGDKRLIEKAYKTAEQYHAGQFRKSGEPYFTHCVAVAKILADMKLDAEAIAAALMHDLVEDTDITLDELRLQFNDNIANIVDGVTKLAHLPVRADIDKRSRTNDREMEYFRKMLMAMGDDVRVMLVKLADRLHNMRTLGYMTEEKQRKIARETLDIFAPTANRLGIWQIKWELEDLSLRYLDPEVYQQIVNSIDEKREDREAYLARVTARLAKELKPFGLSSAIIQGRPKHVYSIYKKMMRKGVPFDQIYDVRAIRVIVETKEQCYLVLGIIHSLWRPIPGEFDDYIAAPKDNFYQSLHSAVLDSEGKTLEIQIRTMEMHEHAEYGIAAHWRYKEGGRNIRDEVYEKRVTYLRRLMEFGPDVSDAASFVEAMKSEVFQDRVYAFTPKGDIVDLPAQSTPIDFAYYIHTEIGHRCRGAKVHGRLVSLDYQLQTGDQVEILTAKRGGPSLDWLNPDLGYVHTERARSKIRTWFKKQNRDKNIASGRDVLEREIKRLGLGESITYESIAEWFGYEKLDDFLAALGAGDVSGAQITHRILDNERRANEELSRNELKPRPAPASMSVGSTETMNVLGTRGLLINLAKCCNPMKGEAIIGYITRGRGVTVHRVDCPNVSSGVEAERLIEVAWGQTKTEQRYSVPIEIVAYDREGLMRDISTVIADEKVNMSTVQVMTRQDIATFYLTMEIADLQHLSRLLNRLECIDSVVEARRRNVV